MQVGGIEQRQSAVLRFDQHANFRATKDYGLGPISTRVLGSLAEKSCATPR